jgi:hypothetical protein
VTALTCASTTGGKSIAAYRIEGGGAARCRPHGAGNRSIAALAPLFSGARWNRAGLVKVAGLRRVGDAEPYNELDGAHGLTTPDSIAIDDDVGRGSCAISAYLLSEHVTRQTSRFT